MEDTRRLDPLSVRKVLIVDDDTKMRKKYKRALVEKGFKVIEAPNALEVANLLMREGKNLDLILLDINIPEIDGREIFDIIDEYAPQLQVIINSVYPISEQRIRIPRAADYYDKSHPPDVLITKVCKVLGVNS
jgi:DNA-binding NtrC family response regulator